MNHFLPFVHVFPSVSLYPSFFSSTLFVCYLICIEELDWLHPYLVCIRLIWQTSQHRFLPNWTFLLANITIISTISIFSELVPSHFLLPSQSNIYQALLFRLFNNIPHIFMNHLRIEQRCSRSLPLSWLPIFSNIALVILFTFHGS